MSLEDEIMVYYKKNIDWANSSNECEGAKKSTIQNMVIEWTIEDASFLIEQFLREKIVQESA